MARCLYKILGVSVYASQEEIKKAYRLLALRWHPDRNPDDPLAGARFREVQEAYEELVDPLKRHRYDRGRGKRRQGKKTRRPDEVDEDPSFEDVFSQFFGIRFAGARGENRTTLRFDLEVSLHMALHGATDEIEYERMVFCRRCSGNGKESPSPGCGLCGGIGAVEERCTLTVKIPPGSRNGQRLRVPGAGDQLHRRMPPGDLVIVLHVT